MDIVLISTTILRDALSAVFNRLLASLETGPEISLLLLLQNTAPETRPALPAYVTALTDDRVLSLSAARNHLLDRAHAESRLHEGAIIAFPDDDCFYPTGLLAQIEAAFAADPTLDLLYCRYASTATPVPALTPSARPATVRTLVRNASSNTLFLRGSLAARIGHFAPDLGVGTPNNGGEDTDYALSAFRASRRAVYIDAHLVGHRDKSPALRAQYYPGTTLALRRHALSDPAIAWQYLRKLAIGLVLVARRELALRQLLQALRPTP